MYRDHRKLLKIVNKRKKIYQINEFPEKNENLDEQCIHPNLFSSLLTEHTQVKF